MSIEYAADPLDRFREIKSAIKTECILEPRDLNALSIQVGCILRTREQTLIANREEDKDKKKNLFTAVFMDLSREFGDEVGGIIAIYEEIKRISPWKSIKDEGLAALTIASIIAFPFIKRGDVRYANADGRFPMGGWKKFASRLEVDPGKLEQFGAEFDSMSDKRKGKILTYLSSDLQSPSECVGDYNEWAFDISRREELS